jgi:hypothetical protein
MFNSFAPAARAAAPEKNNRRARRPPHAYSVLSDGRTIEIHPVPCLRVANDFQLFPSADSLCHECENEVEVEVEKPRALSVQPQNMLLARKPAMGSKPPGLIS